MKRETITEAAQMGVSESITEAAIRGLKAKEKADQQTEAKDPTEWLDSIGSRDIRQKIAQIATMKKRLKSKYDNANVEGDMTKIAKVVDGAIRDLDDVIKKISRARS